MRSVSKFILSSQFLRLLILILFSVQVYSAITSTDYLYSLDPYRHLFFTKYGEPLSFFSNVVPVHNGFIFDRYKTLLRTDSYIFSQVSGLPLFQIFRFGSIFLRALYILTIYLVLIEFTQNESVSLLGTMLLFSSPHFLWRSILHWPDNLANVFFLFAVWTLERYRNTNNIKLLYLLFISMVGEFFTHSPSIYVLGIIVFSYMVYFFISKDYKALKVIIITGIVSIIVAIPILKESIVVIISKTLVANFGETSQQAHIATADPRYTPPDFKYFISESGLVLIPLTAIGFVHLIKDRFRESIPLLIYFSLTFFLSIATYFKIYIPPDRMQAYLSPPMLIISALLINYIFSKFHQPLYNILIAGILFLISYENLQRISPWVGYKNGEIEAAQVINNLIEDSPDTLVWIDRNTDLVIFLMDHPKNICLPDHLWYFSPSNSSQLNDECNNAEYRLSDLSDLSDGYQLVGTYQNYYLYQR